MYVKFVEKSEIKPQTTRNNTNPIKPHLREIHKCMNAICFFKYRYTSYGNANCTR